MNIDNRQLKACMPGVTEQNIEKYLPWLIQYIKKYKVDTPLRLSHFLAQVGHESNSLASYRENLNYSEDGLVSTFKSDFDTNKDRVISEPERLKAKKIARKPKGIANFVYANQNGNGNEASGDGSKYLGRGPIQCTGKENYKELSVFIFGDYRLLNTPEIVELPQYGLLAAFWFWTKHNLNSYADKDDIVKITEVVNGGLNGIDDRKQRLSICKKVFGIY